jgi:hypothetical protein
MTSPEDRAVLLLQRSSELILECRAIARELQEPASSTESRAEAAERIAFGVNRGPLPALDRQPVTAQDALGQQATVLLTLALLPVK